MCGKDLPPNNCPENTAGDTYVGGSGSANSTVCYQNDDGSQCHIQTDANGGYLLPSTFDSAEPVTCNGLPSNNEDDEDKFCYVHNNGGIYSVDCPTTSISIDTTGIQKNADQLAVNHERLANIEASFISQQDIDNLMASGELKGEKGEQGEKGDKGEKGEKGEQGIQGARGAAGADGQKGEKGEQGEKGEKGDKGEKGEQGARGLQGIAGTNGTNGKDGKDGINGTDGIDGEDGEDGEGCSIVSTMSGATISCGESQSELSNGNCSTESLSNGDTKVTCPDGSESTVNGVDEDGIIGALDKQLSEMKKQTDELKSQSESLENIGTYDGEKPVIDYETKPDGYNEIAEFDWEAENFGTVLEEHNQAMRQLPIISAIENFFTTSFGGSCPTWSETVTVMEGSFTVTIDQFCSPAVQSILPMIRAILMLVAGFFAWRIAIE
ncbi:collagen-like protein [Pseudoalteromonas sp. BZK2]|nr:collagen-like protein [Pseudoalteromonas sp. BZK2]